MCSLKTVLFLPKNGKLVLRANDCLMNNDQLISLKMDYWVIAVFYLTITNQAYYLSFSLIGLS